MKKEKVGKKHILPGAALVALVAAVIVYCVLLDVERNTLSNYEKGTVLAANRDIVAGLLITQENVNEYFREIEIPVELVPDAAITNLSELNQKMVVADLDAGAILTGSMLEDVTALVEEMEEPVVAGFKAEDLYQVVSGVLRGGDRIHIYTVDSETGEAYLIWENVYVQAVFDSAGTLISTQDTVTSAQRCNILLEKDSVEQFYAELAGGSLRVVKALNANTLR